MEQRQGTFVTREDVPEWAQFQVSLTKHPIVRDQDGVLRYQINPLIWWIWATKKVDINEMWLLYANGMWSRDVFMQFYRDMGYSLSGFEEVWSDALERMEL